MEQKASEDGNGKRRMQEYKRRKIVLAYSIKIEDGCKDAQTAKTDTLYLVSKKTAANGK